MSIDDPRGCFARGSLSWFPARIHLAEIHCAKPCLSICVGIPRNVSKEESRYVYSIMDKTPPITIPWFRENTSLQTEVSLIVHVDSLRGRTWARLEAVDVGIDFVAIDFETANEKRASICAVGLVFFEDGEIAEELTWIVSPPKHLRYFNPFNVQIHGITSKDVAGKQEFSGIWPEIQALMGNRIVAAHNASFDMGVLRQLLDVYQLEYPQISFICTCCVARKTWDGQINYTLKTLANGLGYLLDHHDPLDDARTCGKILVDACKYHGCNSLAELADTIDMQIGELCEDRYQPCSISKGYRGIRRSGPERIVMEELEHDCVVSDVFSGTNVVFTGTLISMTRQVAAQKVVERGGLGSNSVRRDTNLLVMGLQDYARFADGKESNKTKRARELIAQGKPLEIIDENEFLRRLLQED